MAQAITPELEALLVPLQKLLVGNKKFRGEIEIDYVIPGITEIGDPQDLLLAFGTVINDPANTLDWTNPTFVNDGNGSTFADLPFVSGSWVHGLIADLGAPMEITSIEVNMGDGGDDHPAIQYRNDPGDPWTDPPSGSWSGPSGHKTMAWTGGNITARYWRGVYVSSGVHASYVWMRWAILGIATETTDDSHGTATYQVASLGLDRSRKMAAAQLDVTLDNEDNTRGYYRQTTPVFVPNNPVRAFAWYGPRANRVRVFTGLFDRTHDHRNPKTVALKARSRMKWLLEQGFVAIGNQGADEESPVRTEDNGVYLNKTIEYIVADILDRAGWPSADRVIETTGITLAEYVLADKGKWADQIAGSDRLTTASGCDLVEDELGAIHFERSPLIAASEPTPAWEFAAGVNVLALDHEVDDEERATRVEVGGPMTSVVPAWKLVWQTSILRYPAGVWYDPADSANIRVIDRVTKYIYKIAQSDRHIVSKKYLGGYPLGLSGIPGDPDHYLVLHAPWRNTGSTSGNAIKKYAKADNSLVATYSLPNGRWTAMKSDGTNIFLTNYDDDKLYKRTMTGGAVSSGTITDGGVVQTHPTGLWINGTTIGLFFAGFKRFLLVDSSAPFTVTGTQSTAGTKIAGGEADTDTDIDLFADADAGSFGSTSGYIWKFTLGELVTKDVTALAVDYDLEDALGFQSGIADRDHGDCPNNPSPHPFEARLATYAMKVVQSLAQAGDVSAAQLRLLSRLRRVMDLATVGYPPVQINDPARHIDAIANTDATWIVDSYRAQLSGAGTYTQTMSVLPWEAP